MNRLLSAAAALLCAIGLTVVAPAQMTSPTAAANSLKIGSTPISAGAVQFFPVDSNGIPLQGFAINGGGQSSGDPWSCSITGGGLTGCSVPDACLTTPANILYKIVVADTSTGNPNSGRSYTMQSVVGVCGSTWALDHYGPPAHTTSYQNIQTAHGPTTPSSCIEPSFFTNDTSVTLLQCIGTTYSTVSGTGNGSGTPPNFVIGTVSPLAPGAQPTVSLSGTAPNYTLNFGLPAGAPGTAGTPGTPGAAGTTPTFSIGQVTQLSVGAMPTVSISGTAPAYTLNFGLPASGSGSSSATLVPPAPYAPGSTYPTGQLVTSGAYEYVALQPVPANAAPSGTNTATAYWGLFGLAANNALVTVTGDCSFPGTPTAGTILCTKVNGVTPGNILSHNTSEFDPAGAAAAAQTAAISAANNAASNAQTAAIAASDPLGTATTKANAAQAAAIAAANTAAANAQAAAVAAALNSATTNTASAIASIPYANFGPTLQNLFSLTEGSGSLVTDAVGGKTAAPVAGATVTWSIDSGLTFTGGSANRWQATGVTSMQAMEVCYVQSLPSTGTYNIPIAYGGTTSSSFPMMDIETSSNFVGTTGGPTAFYPSFVSYHNAPTSADVGSTTYLASGKLHCVHLSIPPAGNATEYMDGLIIKNPSATPTLSAALSGGYLEWGGSPIGYFNCAASICGFNGTIYGVATYSSPQSAVQVMRSYRAWINLLRAKGVNVEQNTSTNSGLGSNTTGVAVNHVAHGESITGGHGQTTPATQNFAYLSAATINSGNAIGQALGTDSSNAAIMVQAVDGPISMYSSSALNVVTLFNNANGCKGISAASSPGFTANIATSEANALVSEAQKLTAAGWYVVIGSGLSGNFGSNANGKDQCNAAIRSLALSSRIPFWDIANDPRMGQDAAYNASGVATACSGGPVYQTDKIHPTLCYETFMGANEAVLINRLLFSAPVTTTAAAYTMSGTEEPLRANPSTNSQVITLIDCIGQSQTTKALHIVNLQQSGSNTVTLQPVNTYTTELINGAATLIVPNGGTVTLTAVNAGDATGGCYWRLGS